MRLEAAGEAVGHEARRLDRLLHAHPEHDVVQEDLQHALRLEIAAGRAERHEPLAAAPRERRVRREARALARRDARGVARHRPRLRAARRRTEAEPGNHRALPRDVARRGRNTLPWRSTTQTYEVSPGERRRRVGERRRRQRAVAAGIARASNPRTSPAGGISGHARSRRDQPAPLGGVRGRQQRVHRHADEARIAVVALAVGEAELHRLGHEVHVGGRVVAERAEVVAREQRQHLEQHRPLAPRPAREHLDAVEASRDRRLDLGAIRREVVGGQPAAVLAVVAGDRRGEIAPVEGVARGGEAGRRARAAPPRAPRPP